MRDLPATLECQADDGFAEWLAASGGSLLVSAYDANALLSIGHRAGRVTLLARRFDKPMGIACHGERLALATRHSVVEFTNDPALAQDYDPARPGRYDALYLPRRTHHCGDLNVHELGYGSAGALYLTNTRYSCLAVPGDTTSFQPLWRPEWVTELVPEDRCHLNGLALRDGDPAFVSLFADSDRATGWRDRQLNGGMVVAVADQRRVATGLCMPHSPRWHDGRLWVLESGTGSLRLIDTAASGASAAAITVCRLDGYVRGMAMVGGVAIVGMSKVRERQIFSDLPIARQAAHLHCALALVSLQTGDVLGRLTFEGAVGEVFDVCFVSGARALNLLQADSAAAQSALTGTMASYWLRRDSAAD